MVPATSPSPFFFISSNDSRQLRTPAPSTATGFSAKMCLPAATAALMCAGRNAGGVAMIT